MRVNIYAEEMTDRVEIISKEIEGEVYTGVRFYLELPVSRFKMAFLSKSLVPNVDTSKEAFLNDVAQISGPFIHKPGDDDSAAVTFWGKKDLRDVLEKALALLNDHYGERLSGDKDE